MNYSRFFTVPFVLILFTPGVSFSDFTGGSSDSAVTTVQEFRSQCDLNTDGGGGLLSGLVETAVEAEKCDEMEFTLKGRISGQIDKDLYEFNDESGSVTIRITDWNGIDVGPEDTIKINGSADIEETGLILDVDSLELVN